MENEYGLGPKVVSNAAACIEVERKALISFKEGLKDPSGRLSSWVGKDCCQWAGVGCSKQTGHVIKLHLRNPHNSTFIDPGDSKELEDYKFSCLSGKISLSLLELKYLNLLDLSWNDFQGEPIPEYIGSLSDLSYLDLSSASFSGLVPPHLGNLSNLRYLNLYSDSYRPYVIDNTFVSDLNWIARLPHLEYLNLGYINLSLASNTWMQVANMLPSLLQLHLQNCDLRNFPDSLPTMNLSALRILRLGDNNFNHFLPHWLSNISTLEVLDLSNSGIKGPTAHISWRKLCNLQLLYLSNNDVSGEIVELVEGLSECSNTSLEELQLVGNKLSGQIPESIGHFKYLRSLYLPSNSFSGSIPSSIGRLTDLETLDLSSNAMNGTIPDSIGQLSRLVSLNLKWNSWRGVVSETHFLSLAKLERFYVSSVRMSLAIKIRNEWVPPFSLQDIEVVDCHLGSTFPQWLSTQKNLSTLTLKNAAISGEIPDWLGKLSRQLFLLDLSGNQFGGEIPSSLEFRSSAWVDLSSNFLEGSPPIWYNVSVLRLKSNLLSGPMTLNFCQEMSSLTDLDLSGNSLNGSLPPFISRLKNLGTLVLSNNLLSGNIDIPWKEMSLSTIDLSRNNLSGDIPDSICFSPYLEVLKLFSNNFSGELSPSLQNCTGLSLLDLGENKFSGTIPKWVGDNLSILSELGLRGNMSVETFQSNYVISLISIS
ncbi:unnamed protein product [Dovyalis caffra]|uniref:Leucine-rich repeat-containing N-terminal plant-type domain-containing protein n=1 Tax=Dovyalis caffra TaxID=77055 RepID=A0AAV1R2Y8_9ROSI|nr:unnamed protein product [Dovyalis caffra]